VKTEPKKVIIFDFDGVLADSFDTFYFLTLDGFKRIGLKMTRKKYQELFLNNYHKSLGTAVKYKVKLNEYLRFRNDNYSTYYDKKIRVKLFPGAKEFIKNAGRKNILAIASSGKEKNIKKLLKEAGVDKCFGLILADSKHSKKDMIETILNKYNARPEETIFITDTVGDIKAAKMSRLITIAVTWGFHSRKTLTASKPDKIASNLKSLLSLLK
jgi:phosphoglycolate phosphatase